VVKPSDPAPAVKQRSTRASAVCSDSAARRTNAEACILADRLSFPHMFQARDSNVLDLLHTRPLAPTAWPGRFSAYQDAQVWASTGRRSDVGHRFKGVVSLSMVMFVLFSARDGGTDLKSTGS